MVNDSDLRKWDYPRHTQVKHELLESYIGGWLSILGRWHKRLLIVDGFAGRGEYVDGSNGSPVILLRKSEELIASKKVDSVVCGFVELDPTNFSNLKAVLTKTGQLYPNVHVYGPFNDSFEQVANRLLEATSGKSVPSFWFIDPFGFTGIPFETVRQLMSLDRSEVFITLMLRDMSRFLARLGLEDTYDRLFGSQDWRRIVQSNMSGEAKERSLRDLYVSQLRKIGCKVTVFRVCMDDKLQTLYYMVHATRHPKGRWLMKDVMSRQGADGAFAYLGPQDQVRRLQGTLIPVDSIGELRTQLVEKLAGRSIEFDQLLNECCDDNELRQPDYRKSLQQLRKEGSIAVERVTSKTDRGLQGKDVITFPEH